jgi:hypothetical protein
MEPIGRRDALRLLGYGAVGPVPPAAAVSMRAGGSATRVDIREEPYRAKGDGVSDDTAAIQAALDSGADWIHVPDGRFGVTGTTAALTLSRDGVTLSGPGYLVPLRNERNVAPQQVLLVTGDRNTVATNFWNVSDLPKLQSSPLAENPMDGVRVTGSANVVRDCGIWNFVTAIAVRGGADNRAVNNRCTVKQVENLAWPNDGILWFQTERGLCYGNCVGLATSPKDLTVRLSSVPGAPDSTLRTGITLDSDTAYISVEANHVGEGFVAGIHSEGRGARGHTVANNIIYRQRRNAINAAGGRMVLAGNDCLGSFNSSPPAALSGIIGSVGGATSIINNRIESQKSDVDGIRLQPNAVDVQISQNTFVGLFASCIRGVASNVSIRVNTLRGTAQQFAWIDRPVTATADAHCAVEQNYASSVTRYFAFLGSGMVGTISGNKICVSDATQPSPVIAFGGNYANVGRGAKISICGNDCVLVGPKTSSAAAFIASSVSTADALQGVVRDNSFDTSVWPTLIAGRSFAPASLSVSGNSSNKGAAVNGQ